MLIFMLIFCIDYFNSFTVFIQYVLQWSGISCFLLILCLCSFKIFSDKENTLKKGMCLVKYCTWTQNPSKKLKISVYKTRTAGSRQPITAIENWQHCTLSLFCQSCIVFPTTLLQPDSIFQQTNTLQRTPVANTYN